MAEQDRQSTPPTEARSYEPPRFEVISLSCEISAYAPDEDDGPLF